MYPFTEIQLKELELQTIMFNYFASGIPIPHHLISLFNRSFYVLIDPFALNPMNATKKVEEDPEPWRCKRTDGKKWRCSKEASKDSKYCERHMHRGRRSSRKLVEMHSPLSTQRPNFINQFSNPNIMLRLYEENKHGYVVDTELKLGNGDGGSEKEKEERKPSTLLRLFDECVNAEDSYSLSISFP